MAQITRKSREAELLTNVRTESGRSELLKKLRFQFGLQPTQALPAGTSLVQELLDSEFGPVDNPKPK
jgi:hypothetical protein